MNLKEIRIPSETIEVSDGVSFTVRGLSVDDLAALIELHGPILRDLFNDVVSKGEDGLSDSLPDLFGKVRVQAPRLVGYAIALAAGEIDAFEKVMSLPAPVQVAAFEAIGKLTFKTEDDVKKFVETGIRMMRGSAGLATSLTSLSIPGSGASAAP